MKYLLLIFSIIAFNCNVFCQKDSLRLNSVNIELGNVTGPLSINLDHIFPFNDKIGLIVGFGFSPGLIYKLYSPRFPIQIKVYYQYKRYSFDFGGVITPYMWPKHTLEYHLNKQKETIIHGQIGYKYLIFNNSCYVGISFCPNLYINEKIVFFPWGALRFGYKF
jgi:hypothetical protein